MVDDSRGIGTVRGWHHFPYKWDESRAVEDVGVVDVRLNVDIVDVVLDVVV